MITKNEREVFSKLKLNFDISIQCFCFNKTQHFLNDSI